MLVIIPEIKLAFMLAEPMCEISLTCSVLSARGWISHIVCLQQLLLVVASLLRHHETRKARARQMIGLIISKTDFSHCKILCTPLTHLRWVPTTVASVFKRCSVIVWSIPAVPIWAVLRPGPAVVVVVVFPRSVMVLPGPWGIATPAVVVGRTSSSCLSTCSGRTHALGDCPPSDWVPVVEGQRPPVG